MIVHLFLAVQVSSLNGVGPHVISMLSLPFLHQELLEILLLEVFRRRTRENSSGQDLDSYLLT